MSRKRAGETAEQRGRRMDEVAQLKRQEKNDAEKADDEMVRRSIAKHGA